jgi:subtilase family serine protease
MNRMLLVLKRSDEQEAELQQLLQDQQDKSSPRYHQWLTPEQFGQQFGPADEDMEAITQWLESQGFQAIRAGKGRTVIEFSGTAAHVQRSFGTSIHRFFVNGEEHWANSSEPSIPAALSPAVAGVLTLHNFFKKPDVHVDETPFVANAKRSAHPEFTSGPTDHALAPADFEKIYNFDPSQVPFGSNSTIAVVARSNINTQDVLSFQTYTNRLFASISVVLNGPDPGDLGGDDELEAVLDATWSGLIGPHTVQLSVNCDNRRHRPVRAIHHRQQSRRCDE